MRLRLYISVPFSNNKIFYTATESDIVDWPLRPVDDWVGGFRGRDYWLRLTGHSLTDSNLYRLSVCVLDRPASYITC